MADVKVVDDSHEIPKRRGNGKLRREVWVDSNTGKVTKYNLAYINHKIFSGDNGRVIGFDNAHDGHHKHKMGVIEAVEFSSFEIIEEMFEKEWLAIKDEK